MIFRHDQNRPMSSRLVASFALAPVLLALGGCTDFAQLIARPESKAPDANPQVAAKPAQPTPEPIPTPQEKAAPGKLYEWEGDGKRISHIVINTDEQKARFYAGDEQIGWTTVASGVPKHPTPTGRFEVIEKVANKRSNLYGKIYSQGGGLVRSDAKAGRDAVPAGARFEGAKMPYYLRITYDGVGLHAGPIPRPGHPASHGCIRLPAKMAPVLFEHVGIGTKVSIVGSGPDYGDYAARQRAETAARIAQEKARKEEQARVLAMTGTTADVPSAESAATSGGPQSPLGETAQPAAPTNEPGAKPAQVSASPIPARKPAPPRPAARPAKSVASPAVAASPAASPAPASSAAPETAAAVSSSAGTPSALPASIPAPGAATPTAPATPAVAPPVPSVASAAAPKDSAPATAPTSPAGSSPATATAAPSQASSASTPAPAAAPAESAAAEAPKPAAAPAPTTAPADAKSAGAPTPQATPSQAPASAPQPAAKGGTAGA